MSNVSRTLFTMSVNDKLAFAPLKSAKNWWSLLTGKQAKKALGSYNSAVSKSAEYSKKLADQGITREALDGLNRRIDKTLNQDIREDMKNFKDGMKNVWEHMTDGAPLERTVETGIKPDVNKMMKHADQMKAMLEEGERLNADVERLGALKNQIDASTKSTRYLTGLGVAGVAGAGGLSYLNHKKQEEQQPWYKKIGK